MVVLWFVGYVVDIYQLQVGFVQLVCQFGWFDEFLVVVGVFGQQLCYVFGVDNCYCEGGRGVVDG